MPVRVACAVVQLAAKKAFGLRESSLLHENASVDAGRFETDLFEVGSRLCD